MWPIDRRTFLKTSLAGAFAGVTGLLASRWQRPRVIPGSIVGQSHEAGHLLRDRKLSLEPSERLETPIVIVGSGIAGLSAAWQLEKSGIRDFLVLELERDAGGNAVSGVNTVSAYPWGAHYLPVPNSESIYVRELLEELGVITGYDAAGRPIFDEFHLCAEPDERLHIHGRWQDGLVPSVGLTASDRRELDEFFALVETLRSAKGKDGKPAFAIPVDLSSQDPRFTAYDRITMAELLRQNGWSSEKLNWYVDYCCRDDFGTSAMQTSAWAGLHYFAGRRGVAANAHPETVLTWPAGNGWLVERLRGRIQDRMRVSNMVFKISPQGEHGAIVDTLDTRTKKVTRIQAHTVIWAAPRFVAARVIEGAPAPDGFTYAPWMVANLTLSHARPDLIASWDNVFYKSPSLGYVVATHQNITPYPAKTVLTYYLPLSHKEPKEARLEAMNRSHAEWVELILKDLRRLELEPLIESADIWLWGHGMIRPVPGFIWGRERRNVPASGPVLYAHSDLSGISIFEEAQYQGVNAGREAARRHGARHT